MTANAAAPAATRNLYQRLASVTAGVKVRATGRTAQGQRTISIKDAEDALGDLMAEHGVVSGYHWNARPEVVGQEGKVSTWLADITVWMVNADDREDRLEDHLYDVGSSPSAAVSFALKRYYRAVFHLADESDENRSVSGGRDEQTQSRSTEGRSNGHAQAAEPLAPDDTQYKPTVEETEMLVRLAQALPKTPHDGAWVSEQLGRVSYRSLRDALLHQHRGQCGDSCEHVQAQPSLPVGGTS